MNQQWNVDLQRVAEQNALEIGKKEMTAEEVHIGTNPALNVLSEYNLHTVNDSESFANLLAYTLACQLYNPVIFSWFYRREDGGCHITAKCPREYIRQVSESVQRSTCSD